MTKKFVLHYYASPEQLALYKGMARVTGQATVRDYMALCINEYTKLLGESLERTKREMAAVEEASLAVDTNRGSMPASASSSEAPVVSALEPADS